VKKALLVMIRNHSDSWYMRSGQVLLTVLVLLSLGCGVFRSPRSDSLSRRENLILDIQEALDYADSTTRRIITDVAAAYDRREIGSRDKEKFRQFAYSVSAAEDALLDAKDKYILATATPGNREAGAKLGLQFQLLMTAVMELERLFLLEGLKDAN